MKELKLARRLLATLRGNWKAMLVTDLIYKALALTILTPLFGIIVQATLWISSESVLTDLDIPLFLSGPVGWICAILLGAMWLGIAALEQASLMAILAATAQSKEIGVRGAIEFAIYRVWSVLRLASRLVAWTLLLIAPIAGIAWLVYQRMLSQYDINFYLKERPPEFLGAVSIGAALSLALALMLVRFYSGSFLALQLVLFESCQPRAALKASANIVGARRVRVVSWLVIWFFTFFVLQLITSTGIGWLGRLVIPIEVGSLALLASRVGIMLLLVAASTLLLNVFGVCLMAALLFEGYRQLKTDADDRLAEVQLKPKQGLQVNMQITVRRVAAVCLLLLAGGCVVGTLAIRRMAEEDHAVIMAHRGASFSAPENTLAALRQAIEDGADWVEIDVQETADGEVVVVHDSDLMKLAGNPLKIWDATLADLESIDIGSWFAAKYASERVPTLKQVLELCKDRVGVIIELKYYGHDQALGERVIEIVEDLDMSQQIMIMSLKAEQVQRVRRLRPSWTCGLLMSVAVGDIEGLDVDFLAVNGSFIGRRFVQRLHKANKKVFVWTINDEGTISTLMNCGVDGILTDRPALAKDVLATRSQMTGAELLLAEIGSWFYRSSTVKEQ